MAGDRSEERLAAVTVGERIPLNGTIRIVPYDPEWPAKYARLELQIRNALGAKVLMIEHVGSTSVPNLSAKPIIDIVLAVSNSADEASYVPPLEDVGYVLRIREPYWFEHRLLKSPVVDGNIHVFSERCEEIGRMLAFRDWLRTSDADRKFYENTKRELAGHIWRYTQDYADAKTEVVREILSRALRAG
jgi:GrpB-like predicted nucleotidyltransferase (UPF0157 family)